ncbi:thioredoxin [Weissella muntiaci]|jgi:thioredoxin 1|uniref:Thioredoxin n=1 Tax=Weissella muntiaci TaxID=2508881 RepID=A0A6C2C1G8_9LACO|nr:thioredoxin [Weissella muntiaci]TYC47784.1 thioredoxin [Weissella muntiaci]
MAVENVTDANYETATSQGVTLTDFWAEWCGPCRMQSPVVEELAKHMDGVKFNKLDIDSNPETPSELGIMAIPTLIIKKDGQVVERLTGYTPAHQLEEILNKYTA